MTTAAPDKQDFGGLRVVSFESRQVEETARLVTKAGGIAISAPSLREIPLEDNDAPARFAERLLAGQYDMVVFMTGVGTRYLFSALESSHSRQDLVAALSRVTVVARGPKPVRALGELGVPITITVPEPNTWREMLREIDESAAGITLDGARIAVQEYGVSNERFVDALRSKGANVDSVTVYRWALPEDRRPLIAALRQIIDRTVDVALFTSATQIHHVFQVASEEGLEARLRESLAEVVVGSIGPVCSEALAELGVMPDLEPSRSKLGVFVRECAERAPAMILAKREALRAARPRPAQSRPQANTTLDQCSFLRACRREPVEHTPVWLMRQAGRYMQEYREVRAHHSFLELCKKPDVAAEVTVTAAERLGVDAAIIFSDILLIVEPMGLGLEYTRGEGPSISSIVRTGADVDRMREVDPDESLGFVMEAITTTRASLAAAIPLIGFSGAPFTLASYIIEGGGSKNYIETKRFMYADKGAWDAMMSLIAKSVARYLRAQVDAGCQALQLFDSWVGCLTPADYERYVLPHTKAVIDALPADVPLIHFGTDTATLLEHQRTAGGAVLGVDHRVDIGRAFDRFPDLAIQGNLDPVVLFADRGTIRRETERILREVGARPGHIFNLGHGILPATPVDNVIALVDAVHELSARRAGGA
jgi:uroporphyrinogen decarboxylase